MCFLKLPLQLVTLASSMVFIESLLTVAGTRVSAAAEAHGVFYCLIFRGGEPVIPF